MAVEAATTPSAIDPARTQLAGTIRQASTATGVSFDYLVAAAKIESNLNPQAAAPTSSARGLYQFIEQTWLGTVKEAGAAFGYDRYADAITRTASGTLRGQRSRPCGSEILQLRKDPAANAAMAGVLTRSNSFKLTGALGRRPSDGELYIAHFLGAGGASRLISNVREQPASQCGVDVSARSRRQPLDLLRPQRQRAQVTQVYAELTGRYQVAANSQADAKHAGARRRGADHRCAGPAAGEPCRGLARAGRPGPARGVGDVDGNVGSRKPRARHRRAQLALPFAVPGRRTRRAGGLRGARAVVERQLVIDARHRRRHDDGREHASKARSRSTSSATAAACSAVDG